MPLMNVFADLAPRKVFLIDGIGALVSMILHGFVMIRLETYIGMPRVVLYYLAFAASCFAFYSFACFLFSQDNWRSLLKIIAFVNLSYCLATLILILYFSQSLTSLGLLVFFLEIGIVSTLAILEWKKAVSK